MRWKLAIAVVALAWAGTVPAPNAQTVQPADRVAADDFLGRAVRAAERHKALLALAAERAEHPAVKRFAETIANDIAASVKRLEELASRPERGANRTLSDAGAVAEFSTDAIAQKNRQYQRLKALHGPAFDKQFMSGLVLGYENAIRSFEAEAARGDAATRAFTSDSLPRLRTRLAEARALLAEIQGERR